MHLIHTTQIVHISGYRGQVSLLRTRNITQVSKCVVRLILLYCLNQSAPEELLSVWILCPLNVDPILQKFCQFPGQSNPGLVQLAEHN